MIGHTGAARSGSLVVTMLACSARLAIFRYHAEERPDTQWIVRPQRGRYSHNDSGPEATLWAVGEDVLWPACEN